MTLQQALELARSRPGTDELAVWARETLAAAQPCGFEPPCVDAPNQTVAIMDGDSPLYELSPAEARWFAAELLRGADECDAYRKEHADA